MLTMNTLLTGDAEKIRKEIMKVDLTDLSKLIVDKQYQNFFLANPGREHFMLIASVANLFPNQKIFDIGTGFGLSALAMSMSPEASVISYDITNARRLHSDPSNIEFKFGDPINDPEFINAPLILANPEPHDGILEQYFHQFFLENKYRGIVLWDNIFCNPAITKWWESVEAKKWDITNAGHWSGTGMIVYE